jgi:small subunit ribosomal protein S9
VTARESRAAASRNNVATAVGRRKSAIARVLLVNGAGTVVVNGKPFEEYFPRPTWQAQITLPMRLTNTRATYNVMAKVLGGGPSGQAGAIVHGLSRALVKANETTKPTLRAAGLLTRDAREKERKKYGLKRARKAPQYTKR